MDKKRKILIISGPTGSGESTITNELVKRCPEFQRLVTATSRQMRLGEIDKKDYYFFSKKEFCEKIKNGDILEYTYIENRDTYYGAYKKDLEEKLTTGNIIVNVDYVGVEYYKKNYGAFAIFIKPQALASLATRLKNRNPEMTEEELGARLENARNEIENEEKFYDVTVINHDNKLEKAIMEIENILRTEGILV